MPRLTSSRPEERRKSSSDFPNSNSETETANSLQENPVKTRENNLRENNLHHHYHHRHHQQQQMQELQNSNNNDQTIPAESFHLNIPSHSKTPSPQKR